MRGGNDGGSADRRSGGRVDTGNDDRSARRTDGRVDRRPAHDARDQTTTTVPAPIPKLALGDSVMLGAAPQLEAIGFVVDAVESRQFVDRASTSSRR